MLSLAYNELTINIAFFINKSFKSYGREEANNIMIMFYELFLSFFLWRKSRDSGLSRLIVEVCRSHTISHGPHSSKFFCCSMYCLFCVVLCIVYV